MFAYLHVRKFLNNSFFTLDDARDTWSCQWECRCLFLWYELKCNTYCLCVYRYNIQTVLCIIIILLIEIISNVRLDHSTYNERLHTYILKMQAAGSLFWLNLVSVKLYKSSTSLKFVAEFELHLLCAQLMIFEESCFAVSHYENGNLGILKASLPEALLEYPPRRSLNFPHFVK